MLALALWLKRNGFRADQVQNFLPSPMASATAMYHSGQEPAAQGAARGRRDGVRRRRTPQARRLHKAFLRYHDPANWPLLREALRRMGRGDLIGNGPSKLIPLHQPAARPTSRRQAARGKGRPFRTQHTR